MRGSYGTPTTAVTHMTQVSPFPPPLSFSLYAYSFLKFLALKIVPGKRVVRVMPNTPCLVSEGACGFSLGAHATEKDREVVHSLLGAVGYACEVKEPLLDGERGLGEGVTTGTAGLFLFENDFFR